MGKKLVSKTAKVLSETKKTKEKEAVAIAYEHIPRNPAEQEHGSIYAVIEIADSGGHAEEIAEQIIDVLHSEYYEDCDKEPLESFENSLAKINEALAERSSEGQIHWLGKLNAVLAVLTNNMLHVTQAGKAEAYLYRSDHAMHITEDLAGDSVNPLRTFINVASGELSENDRLALVTPGIFFKLSKSELKRYATESNPISGAENISKIIAGENGSAQPNAVLILEMVSPESFAASSDESEKSNTEIWVTPETKPMNSAAENTLHGAAKAFDYIGKAASGAVAFISAKAIPAVKSGSKKISDSLKNFRKDKDAEKIIIESEEKISHIETPYTDLETDTDDGILANPKEKSLEREIRIKESDIKPKRVSLERFNFSFLSKAKDTFNTAGKRFRLPKGKFSIIYLVIAAVIVVGLTGYLIYNSGIKKQRIASENYYNQAQSKYEEALTNISDGENAAALEDLEAAEDLAENAVKNNYKKGEGEALLSQIIEARDKAMGIVRNTANMYFDFSKGTLNDIFTDGKVYYALSYDNGSVYSLDPASKLTATVIENPKMGGKIKFSTFIPKRNTIVVYTENKEIYEIDLISKKATKQTVSGGLEDAVAMSSYNTNIYLLSPSENQIYKHVSTSSGYGQKTSYFTSPVGAEVQNGISIAIDSNLYLLSSDGFVKKYTAGKRQNYNINNLPENVKDPSLIYADLDVSGQYIISQKNRVIKIDENQSFVSQFVSDSVKNIKDIMVDDETKTIYVLSEGKIFTINF